ncbi:MAG: uroporphyrinogen decarboxylase family protein [Acidobacteriota bacterium]|jgi:uroporphyrinogen decarboxylase|nr:uroporphyrinogen decarboxylase family protein [Acidobacteriota bacterium]
MATELSPRERVTLALEHQETDRVPIAMVCAGINPPAHAELGAHLQRERGISVAQYLEPIIDIAGVGPEYVGPRLEPDHDMWGVVRAPVCYGAGHYSEITHYPLADAKTLDDIAAHQWPTCDWFDYSGIPDAIARARSKRDYCLMAANGNVFECSWYMRGFERIFMDLVLNPDLVHAIMERVTDFWAAHFERILTAARGEIDLVFTADDIGGQEGLLMSLSMWEEFIKPYHARMNRVIHEHGAKVIYHSDGSVMDAVPGLIDMGIDVLQALQFDAAGMDDETLKREYGDRLCFEGGISVQSTLPFGTPAQVEAEVRRRIDVLGRGGGYILGPSHAIQAGTPPENIVALFDTAMTYRPA